MTPPRQVQSVRKAPRTVSRGDGRLIRKLTAHVERHLGTVDFVFHDLLSDVVHLDLLWVRPTKPSGFHTFVTCGMSERPMKVPPGEGEVRFAELVLRLPYAWPLTPAELQGDTHFWPLRELEHVARTPHLYEIHVGPGHVSANGGPDGELEPLASSTRFCGSVLSDPDWTPSKFRRLNVNPGRRVRFFSVIPLYADELILARDVGVEELFQHLDAHGVTDLVDLNRPSAVPARVIRGTDSCG